MFDSLSEKLQATLSDLRSHGTLTEEDVNRAMREIRLALLEADVNFKVVKSFTATVILQMVRERALALADPIERWVPGLHAGNAFGLYALPLLTGLQAGAPADASVPPAAKAPRRRSTATP